MSRNALLALIVLVLIGGYFLMNRDSGSDVVTPEPVAEETMMEEEEETVEPTTVILSPDETNVDVAQGGVATLTETDLGLLVTLSMSGYESDVPQPAHIHAGACPAVDAVVYPLESVVDGSSTTTLEGVTLADLEGQLPLAVNVHKSADETSVYTSCGDLLL